MGEKLRIVGKGSAMHGCRQGLARALTRHRRRAGATLLAVVGLATLSLLAPAGVTVASGDHAKARASAFYNLARPAPPGPPPPHADFVWFPALPHPGESALLASVSTASTSPIVKYAWDLHQGEGFVSGGPTLDTTFTTYAPRIVGLRVIDANGSSDIAIHSI